MISSCLRSSNPRLVAACASVLLALLALTPLASAQTLKLATNDHAVLEVGK